MKVFTDFEQTISPLTDEEKGRLFVAMLRYTATGESPEFSGNERFLWPAAKVQIDRTAKEYENIVERNRENGKKGGRPKKADGFSDNPNNPVGFLETQKSQEKKREEKKRKEKKNTPPISPSNEGGALSRFDAFWEAYPKKKSKGDAEKAWRSLNPDNLLVDRILASVERQKKSAQWKEAEGKYIPYPATWLRAKGWEDEDGESSIDNQPQVRYGVHW